MNWNSWGEFVAMGGYGVYVWGSVLVVFGTLAFEVIEVVWRRRIVLKALRRAGR
ncbi:heme exporter protein CcmD [Aquabacterium sp.]|uniref:heme exporter protein CcmD n=1 Tax=Aquabacterium sp. TaxID=1872578 RepID=UPI003D6D4BFB